MVRRPGAAVYTELVAAVARLLSGPGTGDVPVLRGTVADRPHAVTGPVPLEPTEEVR